ncbi:hypothetical protein M1L60_46125 [Actinoplanes sp. TRM 88003]|uniref:Uncharacterized protein n=1 Tax=Paractinoplanes aksuensis TaxID=2939490 RepID=A0ABT1E759_9ACTN|nr:hypothetical protein [Actinoplanes aksuensis]MCO8277975.1 hypothetical protein [Actinoplanes aksuensis]
MARRHRRRQAGSTELNIEAAQTHRHADLSAFIMLDDVYERSADQREQ